MAIHLILNPKTLKATIYLLLLAITIGCANSTRVLDEVDPQPPIPTDASDPVDTDVDPDEAPVVGPTTTLPSGQIPPPITASGTVLPPVADPETEVAPSTTLPTVLTPVVTPVTTVAPTTNVPNTLPTPVSNVAPTTTPVTTTAPGGTGANPATVTTAPGGTGANPATVTTAPGAVPVSGANVANTNPEHPALSFFMHDILGGSHPSGRVVTGIVASTQVNGVPFSKPNGQLFPLSGGVPVPFNNINGLINNNNVPFLVGLNGSPASTVLQNNGNNNVANGGNSLPFVSAGQLPSGLSVQQLMFGSVTVVDNELTEGHELGSAVLGSAQGFYLSSSLDGTSHTLMLTALFHGGDHDHVDDTISFFGIHRTGSPESQIAVIGGTGTYENAKGYATIATLLHQEDQHTTDGVETITQFSVYLTL